MDENLKNRLLISAIAFGLTVMIYQILFNWQGSFGGFFVALLLGSLAGGAAFGAMTFLQK